MKKAFLVIVSSILVISGCQRTQPAPISPEEVFIQNPTPTILETEKKEINFDQLVSYSWAKLKKHPTSNERAFYPPETVQNAVSFVEKDVEKVVNDSTYFLSVHLRQYPVPETSEVTTTGSLQFSSGELKTIPVNISPIFKDLPAYQVQIETNSLPEGANILCLELKSKTSDEKKKFCRTVILGDDEIILVREWREQRPDELDMYISPNGYYVKVNDVKFFFDENVLAVSGLKYSQEKDLISFNAGYYEGSKTFIFNSKTGELIDDSIGYNALWKKTDNGYRIYTCMSGYYYALKYLDLNPITKEKKETRLANEDTFAYCDVVNEKKIRSLERIIGKKNIFLYKEYSIDDDKVTFKIDELDLNPYVNVAEYLELESSDAGEMLTKAVEKYLSTQ